MRPGFFPREKSVSDDDRSEVIPILPRVFEEKYNAQVIDRVVEDVEAKFGLDELRARVERLAPYVEAQMEADEARKEVVKGVTIRIISALGLVGLAWLGRWFLSVFRSSP